MSALLQGHDYLRRHGIEYFLQDAIQQLLAAASERPLDFLAEYFGRVARGQHVYGRPFAFIAANARNRDAFITLLTDTFMGLDAQTILTTADLHSLVCSLSTPDFPPGPVSEAVTVAQLSSPDISFPSFLRAFRIGFVYSDFLRDAGVAAGRLGPGAGERERLRAALREIAEGWSPPQACPPLRALDDAAPGAAASIAAGRAPLQALWASLAAVVSPSGPLLPPARPPRKLPPSLATAGALDSGLEGDSEGQRGTLSARKKAASKQ
eukprot:tig00020961_g16761.t1